MTWEERLTEIAAIMARGYLRLISAKESEKGLDVLKRSEAPCGREVDRLKSTALLEAAV